ncbi:unnamed protein product, partial [marine sediment metagenome]
NIFFIVIPPIPPWLSFLLIIALIIIFSKKELDIVLFIGAYVLIAGGFLGLIGGFAGRD